MRLNCIKNSNLHNIPLSSKGSFKSWLHVVPTTLILVFLLAPDNISVRILGTFLFQQIEGERRQLERKKRRQNAESPTSKTLTCSTRTRAILDSKFFSLTALNTSKYTFPVQKMSFSTHSGFWEAGPWSGMTL